VQFVSAARRRPHNISLNGGAWPELDLRKAARAFLAVAEKIEREQSGEQDSSLRAA